MSENILTDLNNIASILEDSINESDWSLVVDAYGLLTGREIDEPKTPDNPGDILAELLSRLDRIEGNSKPKQAKEPTKKNSVPKTPEVTKSRSRKPVAKSTNKFEEMTDIFDEVGREPGYDKIKDNIPTQKKRKRSYKPSKIQCVRCNKTFEVNPIFVRDNYKCDNCIGEK